MRELVIFDLDGTLLDTVADLAGSTNHALAECGFPVHEEEEYRFFVGNGIAKLFERALPEGERTEENIGRMREIFVPWYDRHKTDLTRPYPGIEALLESLQNEGVAMAVASNKYHSATEQMIGRYFPSIRFSAVLGNREGIPPKPDPAIVNDILAVAGVARDRTLFVGDSGVDMQTVLAAGITAAGVTWGFRPREELEQFGPAYIIDRPEEVLEIVLR